MSLTPNLIFRRCDKTFASDAILTTATGSLFLRLAVHDPTSDMVVSETLSAAPRNRPVARSPDSQRSPSPACRSLAPASPLYADTPVKTCSVSHRTPLSSAVGTFSFLGRLTKILYNINELQPNYVLTHSRSVLEAPLSGAQKLISVNRHRRTNQSRSLHVRVKQSREIDQ